MLLIHAVLIKDSNSLLLKNSLRKEHNNTCIPVLFLFYNFLFLNIVGVNEIEPNMLS